VTSQPDPTAENELRPLNKGSVRELWSKTYNTEGKPDWSHIFPYYDDKIIFHDTVQHIEGIDEFKAMCGRLTKRCEQLNMDILSVVQDETDIFLQWKMTMIFRRTPKTPVYGCSKLTLGPDGRIVHQRDYYDLWGDVFNGIPGWRRIYRNFLHRLFG
jgi:limonene-1,2-epoxide hydrolase